MSTKQPSSKLINATQRWQASGLAKPSHLKDRLAMLDEIMLRADLAPTEYRICYYLHRMRTNSETGLCFASDRNIADALDITPRAVKKSKQSLKARGILDWRTERINGRNNVCLYMFIYRERVHARAPSNGIPVHQQTPQYGTPVHHQTGTAVHHQTQSKTDGGKAAYYAKFGSAELDAWDAWSRIHTNKSLPRDRAGGWYVATQWPPQRELTLAEAFDL